MNTMMKSALFYHCFATLEEEPCLLLHKIPPMRAGYHLSRRDILWYYLAHPQHPCLTIEKNLKLLYNSFPKNDRLRAVSLFLQIL